MTHLDIIRSQPKGSICLGVRITYDDGTVELAGWRFGADRKMRQTLITEIHRIVAENNEDVHAAIDLKPGDSKPFIRLFHKQ